MAFFDTSNFFQPTKYGWGLHFCVAIVALVIANLVFWISLPVFIIPIVVVAAIPSIEVSTKAIVGGVLGGVLILLVLFSWVCVLVFLVNVVFGVILLIIWLIKLIITLIKRQRRKKDDSAVEQDIPSDDVGESEAGDEESQTKHSDSENEDAGEKSAESSDSKSSE